MTGIILLLVLFGLALLASFPLYLAVKLLGGKTSLVKTLFVNIVVAFVIVLIQGIFPIAGHILSFIIVTIIYMRFFKIGIIRALLLGIVEFLMIFICIALLSLFGLSILGITLFA